MAHFLHLWYLNNKQEVEAPVKELFASKNKNWYQCEIKRLKEKWLQMMQHDGLNFKC